VGFQVVAGKKYACLCLQLVRLHLQHCGNLDIDPPECFLIVADPFNSLCSVEAQSINHILLQQLATPQEERMFSRPSLKPVSVIASLADTLASSSSTFWTFMGMVV